MPLYTYTCFECDKDKEVMCKIDERDSAVCPDCGYRLIRNIDRPGLVWSPTRNGGYST